MKLHQIGITLKGSYTHNFRYVQLPVQVLGKKIYVYEIDTVLEFIYVLGSEIILGNCQSNKNLLP